MDRLSETIAEKSVMSQLSKENEVCDVGANKFCSRSPGRGGKSRKRSMGGHRDDFWPVTGMSAFSMGAMVTERQHVVHSYVLMTRFWDIAIFHSCYIAHAKIDQDSSCQKSSRSPRVERKTRMTSSARAAMPQLLHLGREEHPLENATLKALSSPKVGTQSHIIVSH